MLEFLPLRVLSLETQLTVMMLSGNLGREQLQTLATVVTRLFM